MTEIDDLLRTAQQQHSPEHALALAQIATAKAIQEQTEMLGRIADALAPDLHIPEPQTAVMATVENILGMPPVARPFLTNAVPSDDASALGDGDWVPTPEELC